MDQALKKLMIKNNIVDPENIKKSQEIKAKRITDFYKQKEIIK